ncbi:hypothetical protein A9Q84_13455 [Halobacteriovorax marinus]|uniref:TldD/PmbA family protein n=1 Tax=Halobacteriovorax marinus TaxID=97084 RepID=A0A1Y5F977_9BACT|nr:hypothetical protein A9Q84_13455 [Halobacteriovorax marinus]
MKTLFNSTLELLKENGAEYADIRFHKSDLTESISTLNTDINEYAFHDRSGLGIRVLYNGAWGFHSTENHSAESVKNCAEKALEKAKSSSTFMKEKIQLAPKEKYIETYNTPINTDPFTIPTKEKIDFLIELDKKLSHERFDYWGVNVTFYKREIFYMDSEGSEITKNLLEIDASFFASAQDVDQQKQSRNFILFQEKEGTVGWDNLLSEKQFLQTERIKNELLAVLDAPECKEEICDVILLPEMMALQTHETIGHALELDRILGYELSYAGGSHVDLEHFNELQFGTSKLNAWADGTLKCSPGSYGFDDDGVKAVSVQLIENGKLRNAITSRQMIVEANKKANKEIFKASGAACRAQSYSNFPIERMNNINVDFGNDGSIEELIKSCKNGIILESPKSWSIGSNRENFHFATEIGWKVIDGKISHVVRNPTYRGDSLKFWNSLERVGDESTWQVQQVFNCGKGQPNQVMRLGHGVPVCLFKDIQIGN